MSDFDSPILIVDDEIIEVAGIIATEKPQQCDDCGEIAGLRPYGPRGSMVCFPCGMKDEAEAKRQFRRVVFGEGES